MARGKMSKIVCGTNNICGDVRRERGDAKSEHRNHEHDGIGETSEYVHWVPDSVAEDNRGCRGHRYADEGVKGHGRRQTEGLADDLIALGDCVARKIGDIERESGPKANHSR